MGSSWFCSLAGWTVCADARRLVALKLIKAEWWGDSTEPRATTAPVAVPQQGAGPLAQLQHDHIVPIYDVGHAEGVVYFSMQLIRGRSLGRIIRDGGPLDPRQAAAYLEPIARAVQYAHDLGLVHRDIKPANVMVADDGRPYLIDLGLCKSLEATDATSHGRPADGHRRVHGARAGPLATGSSAPGVNVYGLGATLSRRWSAGLPSAGPAPAAGCSAGCSTTSPTGRSSATTRSAAS